jgi:hypothetical protein
MFIRVLHAFWLQHHPPTQPCSRSAHLILHYFLGSARFYYEIWNTCSVPPFFVTAFSQTIISPSVDFGCNLCMIYLVLFHFFWFYCAAVCPSF